MSLVATLTHGSEKECGSRESVRRRARTAYQAVVLAKTAAAGEDPVFHSELQKAGDYDSQAVILTLGEVR